MLLNGTPAATDNSQMHHKPALGDNSMFRLVGLLGDLLEQRMVA